MPSRRSHAKSRRGCNQCKARRVKCDEKRPICSYCEKREEKCTYGDFAGAAAPLSPTRPRPVVAATAASSYELVLMHQWSLETYQCLGTTQQDRDRWRSLYTKVALEHGFLLHSLFSLTALHLAYLEPKNALRHADMAVAYQDQALSELLPMISNPTVEQCGAMFLSAALVAVTTFTSSRIHPASKGVSPSASLIHLARLLSGCEAIIDMCKKLIGEEDWEAFFPDLPNGPQAPIDSETSQVLDRLHALATDEDAKTQADDDKGRPGTFVRSVEMLRSSFMLAYTVRERVLAWAVEIGTDFMDALEAGHPLARAITLIWGVLLRALEGLWWAAGSDRPLVDELAPLVLASNPEWHDIVAFARARVGSSDTSTPHATPSSSQ